MTLLVTLGHGKAACSVSVSGSGPTVLLIHGAEADRRSFAAMTRVLSLTTTVVSYDQRSCGESVDDGSAHSVLDLADDAQALLGALGCDSAYVFGTSFGGRVAQALAIRHPDRVAGLILCNTWPLGESLDTVNPDGARRLRDLRARLPGSAHDLAAMFYTEKFVAQNPACAARFTRAGAATARARIVAETHDLALTAVKVPTLLLSGALDPIAPTRVMRGMQSAIPQAALVVMPETAHSAAAQRPEALCDAILTFISHQEARGGNHG